MYQALYRKYRPMVFSDVAGQSHVTDTLRAQVAAGRLSHAYLFTGTRGTGKTTCAKILARAANCLSPENGNPCNRCAPCLGALDGSLTDIAEIDAASNSGVDNIRSLRDETAYSPVSAKMRVYIIDEVHMLSSGAFNALLKTLEEPPPYVLFVLATTETHKVPATILSRCQRFAFKRISEADIAARLSEVAARENMTLTHGAAELLARLADGALRDGLSLLDQCGNAEPGWTLDTAAVRAALGLAGTGVMSDWIHSIRSGGAEASIALFREQLDMGRDAASLLGELSQAIRDGLMENLKNGADAKLLSMLNQVQDTLGKLPRAPRPRIEAELGILKMCVGETAAVTSPAEIPVSLPKPVITAPKTEPKPSVPVVVDASWETVRERAAEMVPPSFRAFLTRDISVDKTEGLWQLRVADELTRERLSDKRVTDALESAAARAAGHPVTVRVTLAEREAAPPNPKLQGLLDNFNK
ncbi:hypothetical protein FACS18949_03690 [Clostridia bacterium]|nr:hypothetical protein FACS18949_03690 [Clostridia bacterium]